MACCDITHFVKILRSVRTYTAKYIVGSLFLFDRDVELGCCHNSRCAYVALQLAAASVRFAVWWLCLEAPNSPRGRRECQRHRGLCEWRARPVRVLVDPFFTRVVRQQQCAPVSRTSVKVAAFCLFWDILVSFARRRLNLSYDY